MGRSSLTGRQGMEECVVLFRLRPLGASYLLAAAKITEYIVCGGLPQVGVSKVLVHDGP